MVELSAEVFQNEYLAQGAEVVDAVVTVTATGGTAGGRTTGETVEVIVIDTSGSMSGDRGRKIVAAREATKAAIDVLRDGVLFAVVGGTEVARTIYPTQIGLARADAATRTKPRPPSMRSAPRAAPRSAPGCTPPRSWSTWRPARSRTPRC